MDLNTVLKRSVGLWKEEIIWERGSYNDSITAVTPINRMKKVIF